MGEERILFASSGFELEGLLAKGKSGKGVVVTHPHPLYGGDMHNNVVAAITSAYHNAAYTTLRFNFRGVGRSGGQYDDGKGEQEDIKSALAFLKQQGCQKIDLAGYSFGVWVGAMGLKDYHDIDSFIMVSPPVAFLDFSFLEYDERIDLIITGGRDEIAPSHMIQEMKDRWNPKAELFIVENADHFYWGEEQRITGKIEQYLSKKIVAS